MTLTRTKKIAGGLALSATMLTGIVTFAQPQQGPTTGQNGQQQRDGKHDGRGDDRAHDGGMRRGRLGGFARNLNLTDAQQQQMKQIAERYHAAAQANHQQSRGEKDVEFDSFPNGTFDEAAVRVAAQARANAHVEMEIAHARMVWEMYNVLTPEQKAQLATERQQREQRRQEWRSRRQANPNQSE